MIVNNDQESHCFCKWEGCNSYLNKLELAKHVLNHMIPGPLGLFYCKWKNCNRGGRAFNAKYKMLIHIRTHTNDKPYQCYTCGKSFTRTENLKIHARTHTGEKPYVCSVNGCNKAYSNSSDRFKHTRTHFIEKPYACRVDNCMKRYTDPSSLRKHAKSHNQQIKTIQDANQNRCSSRDPIKFVESDDEPLDLSKRLNKK